MARYKKGAKYLKKKNSAASKQPRSLCIPVISCDSNSESDLSFCIEIHNSDSDESFCIEIFDCCSDAEIDLKMLKNNLLEFDFDFFPAASSIPKLLCKNDIGFAEFISLNRDKKHVDQIIYGLDHDDEELNLDLERSNVESFSEPLITFDIDSMVLKFDDAAIKKKIDLSLICSSKSLISKDFGFKAGNHSLIHVPHMIFGELDNWTIYLFFPNLFDNCRKYHNGVSVTKEDRIDFFETVLYPSLYEIASPLSKQRLPMSYVHACAIAGGQFNFNLTLDNVEFARLMAVLRQKTRMSKKFRKFELYASMKGKKMEFTSSHEYFALIDNVAGNWFILEFVSNFLVDIAKTFTPSTEFHTFCFKKDVLKRLLETLTGSKNVKVFKEMNCRDIEGANVYLPDQSIRFVQAYNTCIYAFKTFYGKPFSKFYKMKSGESKGFDIKNVLAAFNNQISLLESSISKSFGVRIEFRIDFAYSQSLLDNLIGNGFLEESISSMTWLFQTHDIIEFQIAAYSNYIGKWEIMQKIDLNNKHLITSLEIAFLGLSVDFHHLFLNERLKSLPFKPEDQINIRGFLFVPNVLSLKECTPTIDEKLLKNGTLAEFDLEDCKSKRPSNLVDFVIECFINSIFSIVQTNSLNYFSKYLDNPELNIDCIQDILKPHTVEIMHPSKLRTKQSHLERFLMYFDVDKKLTAKNQEWERNYLNFLKHLKNTQFRGKTQKWKNFLKKVQSKFIECCKLLPLTEELGKFWARKNTFIDFGNESVSIALNATAISNVSSNIPVQIKSKSIGIKSSSINLSNLSIDNKSKNDVFAPRLVNFASSREDPIISGYILQIFSTAVRLGIEIKDEEFSMGLQIDTWSVDKMLALLRDEQSLNFKFCFVTLSVEPDFLAPLIISFKRFGTVHYFPNHFIASVVDFNCNQLVIYDSLLPKEHSADQIQQIRNFWGNVFSLSIYSSNVSNLKVNYFQGPHQNINDCGINAIFFLINFATGTFSLFDEYKYKSVSLKYSQLMRSSIFHELKRINRI